MTSRSSDDRENRFVVTSVEVRRIVGRSHSPPKPPAGGAPCRFAAPTPLLRSYGRKLPPSLRRSGASDGVGLRLNTRPDLQVAAGSLPR